MICATWMNSNDNIGSNLKKVLLNELVSIEPPPAGETVDIMYVLGGNQTSLELKYRIAAKLYNQGMSDRILILSRPGITEYSTMHKKNLKNDEWSVQKIETFGVPKGKVESIEIDKVFFGTLSEAKSVSGLVKQRGYKSVLLIVQKYHSKRAILSFKKFLSDANISAYVKCSSEVQSLGEIIVEFIKLKVYENWLLN
jgi:hypothetical protein